MPNRLNDNDIGTPTRRTPQEWCEFGNAYLRGERPAVGKKFNGQFIAQPRHDVRWVVRNGRPTLESK